MSSGFYLGRSCKQMGTQTQVYLINVQESNGSSAILEGEPEYGQLLGVNLMYAWPLSSGSEAIRTKLRSTGKVQVGLVWLCRWWPTEARVLFYSLF